MAERAVVSTNQFRSERGTVTTSSPALLYPVEVGGVWGWSSTGPAEGAILTVGGVTHVDEVGSGGLTAMEVNGRLAMM